MVQLIFWIIAIILILLVFLFIKADHVKHKFFWIVIIIVAAILYFGFMLSVSGKNIDLNTADGIKTAGQLYLSWLSTSFNNINVLTGQAIKMDWRGGNESAVNSANKIPSNPKIKSSNKQR